MAVEATLKIGVKTDRFRARVSIRGPTPEIDSPPGRIFFPAGGIDCLDTAEVDGELLPGIRKGKPLPFLKR